jgi:hypothetical protein
MNKKNNTGEENTGENNSGYWNSGNWNSGYWNSGYRNSGDRNSGYWNSGNWNSGNRNSGDRNSGYRNSGDRNSGDWNSGYRNSGDRNSGYGNSTNRESGIFNSEEPTIRMFNKATDKKWDEIDHPHFEEFYLTKWIPESEMTEAEKIADPQFYVRQGYLKTFTYKEAWANFWKDTDEANRKKFLALPNFSWDVFTDITGIKAGENGKKEELLKKAQKLIDKAEELKEQANKF